MVVNSGSMDLVGIFMSVVGGGVGGGVLMVIIGVICKVMVK